MKKLNTLIYLLIIQILSVCAQQEWTPLESGTVKSLTSVFFIDDTGYAVGGSDGSTFNNIVLKTIDSGKSWNEIFNPEKKFVSIYFTNSETGFAVDYKGIVKSSDGGVSWQRVFDNQSLSRFMSLKKIYFVDSKIGFCVGGWIEFSPVLKTIDGGENWVEKTNNLGTSLTSCYFIDDKIGYAVGYNGNVFKTTNGGDSWSKQISGTSNALFSVFFINRDIGWAVGYGGRIIKTSNGGKTWLIKNNEITNALFSVCFLDSLNGCAVGGMRDENTGVAEYNETILVTEDGGENWHPKFSGKKNNLFSVFFTNKMGYAVGGSGTIIHSELSGLNSTELIHRQENKLKIYPNPTKDYFMIEFDKKDSEFCILKIVDLSGHLIYKESIKENILLFDKIKLDKGIYIITIKSDENLYLNRVIIN